VKLCRTQRAGIKALMLGTRELMDKQVFTRDLSVVVIPTGIG
jgi:hypothetical protein